MTALVAILNKQSVALAADSAVTTGDAKIFNTVNKLFALSKHQPVGIMVYSSAEVMGVPVETVIKEFRRLRGPESCEHLEGYSIAFRNFLCEDNSLFTDERRSASLCAIVDQVANTICNTAYDRLATGWGHPTQSEARRALADVVSDYDRYINACEPIDVPSDVRNLIIAATDDTLMRSIDLISQTFGIGVEKGRVIRRLVINQFFRQIGVGRETGFVVSGFGTADVFPRLRSFEFHCSAFGFHKIVSHDPIDISAGNIARIAPFAQKDVMATFVEGMGPVYRRAISSFLIDYFEEKKRLYLSQMPPQTNEAAMIEDLSNDLVQRLAEELNTVARDAFISPTMQVVASMPKEELVILAEALVNLTALKRKASNDAETVGGPTDVAVISKGDGFVWIKRKHYFDPKFNPSFVATH